MFTLTPSNLSLVAHATTNKEKFIQDKTFTVAYNGDNYYPTAYIDGEDSTWKFGYYNDDMSKSFSASGYTKTAKSETTITKMSNVELLGYENDVTLTYSGVNNLTLNKSVTISNFDITEFQNNDYYYEFRYDFGNGDSEDSNGKVSADYDLTVTSADDVTYTIKADTIASYWNKKQAIATYDNKEAEVATYKSNVESQVANIPSNDEYYSAVSITLSDGNETAITYQDVVSNLSYYQYNTYEKLVGATIGAYDQYYSEYDDYKDTYEGVKTLIEYVNQYHTAYDEFVALGARPTLPTVNGTYSVSKSITDNYADLASVKIDFKSNDYAMTVFDVKSRTTDDTASQLAVTDAVSNAGKVKVYSPLASATGKSQIVRNSEVQTVTITNSLALPSNVSTVAAYAESIAPTGDPLTGDFIAKKDGKYVASINGETYTNVSSVTENTTANSVKPLDDLTSLNRVALTDDVFVDFVSDSGATANYYIVKASDGKSFIYLINPSFSDEVIAVSLNNTISETYPYKEISGMPTEYQDTINIDTTGETYKTHFFSLTYHNVESATDVITSSRIYSVKTLELGGDISRIKKAIIEQSTAYVTFSNDEELKIRSDIENLNDIDKAPEYGLTSLKLSDWYTNDVILTIQLNGEIESLYDIGSPTITQTLNEKHDILRYTYSGLDYSMDLAVIVPAGQSSDVTQFFNLTGLQESYFSNYSESDDGDTYLYSSDNCVNNGTQYYFAITPSGYYKMTDINGTVLVTSKEGQDEFDNTTAIVMVQPVDANGVAISDIEPVEAVGNVIDSDGNFIVTKYITLGGTTSSDASIKDMFAASEAYYLNMTTASGTQILVSNIPYSNTASGQAMYTALHEYATSKTEVDNGTTKFYRLGYVDPSIIVTYQLKSGTTDTIYVAYSGTSTEADEEESNVIYKETTNVDDTGSFLPSDTETKPSSSTSKIETGQSETASKKTYTVTIYLDGAVYKTYEVTEGSSVPKPSIKGATRVSTIPKTVTSDLAIYYKTDTSSAEQVTVTIYAGADADVDDDVVTVTFIAKDGTIVKSTTVVKGTSAKSVAPDGFDWDIKVDKLDKDTVIYEKGVAKSDNDKSYDTHSYGF